MAKVFRTQVLGQYDLDFVISMNGSPVDADTITYEIQDISTGSPVSLIGPLPGVNFSEGHYYAAWTVPDAQNIGTHRVIWRWRLTPVSPWQSEQEEFEVLASSGSPNDDLYLSIQDLYNDGLPPGKYKEPFLEERMRLVQDYMERITGTIFKAHTHPYKVSGSGSQLLKLPYPPLEITEVAFDEGFNQWRVMPLEWFEFYTDFEDRDYPRAMINTDLSAHNIFVGTLFGEWPPGTRNIRITGSWGWVDKNGNTPSPIKDVFKKLLKKFLNQSLKTTPSRGGKPGVKSQSTDGHSYTISEAMAYGTLTGYPEIDSILTYYTKGPTTTIINRRSVPWS